MPNTWQIINFALSKDGRINDHYLHGKQNNNADGKQVLETRVKFEVPYYASEWHPPWNLHSHDIVGGKEEVTATSGVVFKVAKYGPESDSRGPPAVRRGHAHWPTFLRSPRSSLVDLRSEITASRDEIKEDRTTIRGIQHWRHCRKKFFLFSTSEFYRKGNIGFYHK